MRRRLWRRAPQAAPCACGASPSSRSRPRRRSSPRRPCGGGAGGGDGASPRPWILLAAVEKDLFFLQINQR